MGCRAPCDPNRLIASKIHSQTWIVITRAHILPDWDLDMKEMLIRKGYEALTDGGALHRVFEAIIADEPASNAFGLLLRL